MNGGLEIRRATEKDLAEVVLLERETSTSPHWAWAEYAGMQRTGHGADTQAELESVVVRSEDRREGIGSALCRAVMDWSRREGAHEITLEVRASSSGAIRLYGGLGFVAVGRRPAYYHEPPEDAVIMHCFLAGSSPVITHHMNGQAELF